MTWIYATLPPGGDPAAVEATVDEELARIADEGVTEAELEKARNMALASFWRQMATISGKANALGTHEMLYGGWEGLFTFPDTLRSVSSEDLAALAAEIYQRRNRTVATLTPEEAE